ncbi:MAG: hypothetical protein GY721_09105, partial [Deltaproteobacteria bacterium]|nr:hypothetical protein [Deltaproteobacteria bacterium]
MIEQVVAEAIGFLSRVYGRADVTLVPGQGLPFEAGDGGDVLSGMETDKEKGIAQAGLAFFCNVAGAAEITTFLGC